MVLSELEPFIVTEDGGYQSWLDDSGFVITLEVESGAIFFNENDASVIKVTKILGKLKGINYDPR